MSHVQVVLSHEGDFLMTGRNLLPGGLPISVYPNPLCPGTAIRRLTREGQMVSPRAPG